MRSIAILIISLAVITPAFAQMSPQDAAERLADRLAQEKAAAIASTQPSGLTNGDIDRMQKMIQDLIAENNKLTATIANLQQQIQPNQAAANAGPSFFGETEPRVGMTMADINKLPFVNVELISENTSGAEFRVSTGRVKDYGQRTIQDLPSMVAGPQSHTENIVVGSHPAKIERVIFDASTSRVVEVKPDPDY